MRTPRSLSILFAFCYLLPSTSKDYGQRPVPPGMREADKKINAPTEPPVIFKQRPADPTKLKQEAEELAQLSAAIPSQMNQVSRGQIPKDLADKLKRIEKLAKHLRNELTP